MKDNNILELKDICKNFGTVIALQGINFSIKKGEVHCLLGDNGAGKSTLIKILSGVYTPSSGTYLHKDTPQQLKSPRDAIKLGIGTVYQDLSLVPLMSITRNFFMGRELYKSYMKIKILDLKTMDEITYTKLRDLGINIRSPRQNVGTMSGGERQSLAIARAVYFGAQILILDEPTAALGVKQTTNVLKTIHKAKTSGVSVILITHNVRHAMAVGDRFTVLDRGQTLETCNSDDENLTLDYLQNLMAGGTEELADLTKELGEFVSNV